MKTLFASFLAGVVFALGLAVAGMTQPARIIAFLNLTGDWQAGLLLVMLGATVTYLIGYRLVMRRSRPLLAGAFALPEATLVDARLLTGAALFGAGWGLVGLCPGPALVTLASGHGGVVLFVLAMLAGMAAHELPRRLRASATPATVDT